MIKEAYDHGFADEMKKISELSYEDADKLITEHEMKHQGKYIANQITMGAGGIAGSIGGGIGLGMGANKLFRGSPIATAVAVPVGVLGGMLAGGVGASMLSDAILKKRYPQFDKEREAVYAKIPESYWESVYYNGSDL